MVSSFPEDNSHQQPGPHCDQHRHDAEKDWLIFRGLGEPVFQPHLLDFNNVLAVTYQFPLLKARRIPPDNGLRWLRAETGNNA